MHASAHIASMLESLNYNTSAAACKGPRFRSAIQFGRSCDVNANFFDVAASACNAGVHVCWVADRPWLEGLHVPGVRSIVEALKRNSVVFTHKVHGLVARPSLKIFLLRRSQVQMVRFSCTRLLLLQPSLSLSYAP